MSALGFEGSESLNQMCLFGGVEDGATAAGTGEGPKTRAIISRTMTVFMASAFARLEGGGSRRVGKRACQSLSREFGRW